MVKHLREERVLVAGGVFFFCNFFSYIMYTKYIRSQMRLTVTAQWVVKD